MNICFLKEYHISYVFEQAKLVNAIDGHILPPPSEAAENHVCVLAVSFARIIQYLITVDG